MTAPEAAQRYQNPDTMIKNILTAAVLLLFPGAAGAASADKAIWTWEKESYALVEDTAGALAAIMGKKNISLSNLVPAGLEVRADRDKVLQVLINLLDNAVKYNKEGGGIKISTLAEEAGVKVLIEDTGPGIPAEHLPRIFERFYRVDKARSRELGGTGLGLSIVKHLVELHGGRVGVESSVGRGSVFWFTIPPK